MKVLLVSPPVMDFVGGRLRAIAMDAGRECPPYGVYLLSSVLKRAGHDVTLADLVATGTHSIEPYLADLRDCSLVGIGATTLSWPTAVQVLRDIRQARADVPIVLGGIHPSMFDRYVLRTFPAQYVIRGEAERALPALCEALEKGTDLSGVPNLTWARAPGDIVRNPAAPLLSGEELASFPLPDYAVLPSGAYKSLSLESSRGCAFDCSFCSTSYRRSWRAIPPERFVDRLEQLLPYLPRTVGGLVHVVDDEFSTRPRRAIEIAQALRRRGLSPGLVFNARATDVLAPGFTESVAGFTRQFLVGAESGYDACLKRIGKGTTCRILEDAARTLERHGMAHKADFSFILGLPWEELEDVKRTISFAMHLLCSYGVRVVLQWYTQIPGSRLWDEARRAERVHESMYDEFGFFRNLYLTRGGIRLSPSEIWEVWEILRQTGWLVSHLHPGETVMRFGLPPPIAQYFPLDRLQIDGGLSTLRELSRPGAKVSA